ncbi:MAG: hypothetical protein ACREXY_19225, partial [Gammaproteobacteria bacterium]
DRGTEQGLGYMPSRARLTETLPRSGLLEQTAAADERRGSAVAIPNDQKRRSRLSGMALGITAAPRQRR